MKPSIPKGTRDFSPEEMVKRNYIFDSIKAVYQRYGYQPIETPSMENIETLMGKYGEEGDKLIFKILNSGNFLEDVPVRKHVLKDIGEGNFSKMDIVAGDYYPLANIITPNEIVRGIAEKALRYDLTVPFARYVVQHQNEITFPFKRYQIQPVWRADRPQKGRYREFYQCDADVIGSNSLLNEVELIQIITDVFAALKLPVIIKINNRKVLSGIAEVIGESDKIIDITVAIDKLDKIGVDGVNKELNEKGISASAIEKLQPIINFKGDYAAKISTLKTLLANSEVGKRGIEEIEYVFKTINALEPRTSNLELDITLARGLNYYTGAIFEVKANAGSLTSSICGGGRYDDLTGIFGLPNVSGVGISFGADRIYDVLEEANLFPPTVNASTKLLFTVFGDAEQQWCLPLLKQVRDAGIAAELYPDVVKIKKQFDYANKKQIPFVAVVGGDEMQSGQITLKNMVSGEQEKVSIVQLIEKVKSI